MKILLVGNLPKRFTSQKVQGIYKITFNSGVFYIGSSINLRSRYHTWRQILKRGRKYDGDIGLAFIQRISDCGSAVFSVIKYTHCATRDELYKEEGFELRKHRKDPLLLNSILHPKNPIIQYTKDMIEVARFPSLKEAANTLGVFQRRIQDVVNGRKKSTRGFIFKYENR